MLRCPKCRHKLSEPYQSTTVHAAAEAAATGSTSPTPTALDAPTADSTRLILGVGGSAITVTDGQSVGLGRSPDYGSVADVFAPYDNVSRIHAMIRFEGQRVYVTDLESANHTYIDGVELKPLAEYELRAGQSLRFAADVPITFRQEST